MRVEADETDLADFMKVCGAIQYLGAIGANREVRVRVDGDGSARFRFYIEGEKIPNTEFGTGYYGKDYVNFYIGE